MKRRANQVILNLVRLLGDHKFIRELNGLLERASPIEMRAMEDLTAFLNLKLDSFSQSLGSSERKHKKEMASLLSKISLLEAKIKYGG